MIPNVKDVGAEQYIKEVDWKQLERKHAIVIEGNRATVTRRWLLGNKPLFTAVAFLGTKAVDVKMNSRNGRPGSILEWDTNQTLTESNVASELETACVLILGYWDAAQRFVNAE